MKHCIPMNLKEFSDFLCTIEENKLYHFGCFSEKEEDIVSDDVDFWYFIKIIRIEEYGSRFILIDYCGGEEAYAIPLNNYSHEIDEDDKNIIPYFVKKFFKNNDNLNEDSLVYVEV